MLKKIFTNAYMVSFIYVPIIVHIAGVAFLFSLRVLSDLNLFRFHEPYFHDPYPISSIVFVHLLALFWLLLSLGSFGYFWAKKLIYELNFKTYFMIFAVLIYALFCMNLAFLISGWSYASEYFSLIALFSNPLFILINYILVDESLPLYAFLIQVVSYAIFSISIILALWKKGLLRLTKPVKILTPVLFILTLTALSQWSYRNSLFIAPSVAELERFDDSGSFGAPAIALSGEPTIYFDDKQPKIDAATSFCSIYISVVEGLYKKSDADERYCSRTDAAYFRLVRGAVDLIFVFAPSSEQLQMAKDEGVELILTPVGKEAFVFLTNRENPVKNLSVEQIRQIYAGKITNWREVGGENEKILAFQRNKNSGSQTTMEKYVMKGLSFKAPLKEEFHTMGGMIEGVADYRNAKNAIGYSFRYYATDMKSNENIQLLSINGVEPTPENIANGSYPLTQEFYIVARKGDIAPNAQKLIDWFLSDQGQALIKDVGYIPIVRQTK
ncbi:MAG: substrate-binding domain-containing protein [Helicobacteraceae bacterium]|jgi:phosphate transport system substrate-binding protein|nr:substrate-binding domain-containing protein [Helicobacteraceae bacterium]